MIVIIRYFLLSHTFIVYALVIAIKHSHTYLNVCSSITFTSDISIHRLFKVINLADLQKFH